MRWEKILGIDERIRYVRRVKFLGYMSLDPGDETAEEEEVASSLPSGSFTDKDEDESEEHEDEGDEDHFFKPSKALLSDISLWDRDRWDPRVSRKEAAARNQECLPLAWLLKRVPNLRDVVYSCNHRIPICILTALNQRHPDTRLHLHTFSLRNLRYGGSQPGYSTNDDININLDEFLPLNSLCLYSIILLHDEHDYHGRADYYREAALERAPTSALSLKHVLVWHCPLSSTNHFMKGPRVVRDAWHRDFGNDPRRVSEFIRSTRSPHYQFLDILGIRNNQMDFSRLHSLEIHNIVSLDVIQRLTRIAKDGALSFLHTLGLRVIFIDVERPPIDEATSLLLRVVPPLKVLKLAGPVADCTLSIILARHGETLRNLQFIPACVVSVYDELFIIHDNYVDRLSKGCPNLKQLELRIRRTGGDEEEMSIYRALSTLRRLKRVTLFIDCSHSSILFEENSVRSVHEWPKFDEEEAALHLRETLVNSAIDSSLALGIFRAIFTTTNANQSQTLKLQPIVSGYINEQEFSKSFSKIASWIARSWVCTRYPGDGGGEVRVRDLTGHSDVLTENWEDYDHGKLYKRIWRELWPEEEERMGDWRKNWKSFPLSIGEGKEKMKERTTNAPGSIVS